MDITSQLIDEIVSYRQIIDDMNGLENIEMRCGDNSFSMSGPFTIGKLRLAMLFFKIEKK